MNNRGQIFLEAELITGLIVLVVLAITFFFFKSFFVMILALILGGFVLWKVFPIVDKKQKNIVLGVGLLIIFGGLFVGIAQPLTVLDFSNLQSVSAQSGSLYAGDSQTSGHIVQAPTLFSVVSCSPFSPYDQCYQNDYSYGDAKASAKIITYNTAQKIVNGFFDKSVYWGWSNSATKTYYTDICYSSWDLFWKAANCNESGCQLNAAPNTNQITLVSNYSGSYSNCPTVVAWTYNASATNWVYSSAAWGWNAGNKLTINSSGIAQCSVASDCPSPQICDSVTRRCVVPECTGTQEKCVGLQYYSCQDNHWFMPTSPSGLYIGKCGVECLAGQPGCDGTTIKSCIANKWVSGGIVKGSCGVQCLTNNDCAQPTAIPKTQCSSGVLFKAIPTNTCTSYKCGLSATNEKIKDCVLGCGTNTCNEDDLPTFVMNNSMIALGIIVVIVVVAAIVLIPKKKRRR